MAVFDTGRRRNRFAASSHGFLAQDGRAPGAIVADARAQLAAYSTVQWFDSAVTAIAGRSDAFELEAADAAQRARRIILSVGVADSEPRVRPWNAPRIVMMSTTSVARVSFAYFRASLIAASLASVPELQKKARSPNEWSTRSFAR